MERHYAYSLCAPARASLLTGRWPHRAYETSSMRACKGVSPGMSTIAERLKEGANYATHFVGCVLLFYSPICLCSDLRSPVCAYTQQMARRLRHQLVHAVDARLRLVVWILRLRCRLQHKMLIQGGAAYRHIRIRVVPYSAACVWRRHDSSSVRLVCPQRLCRRSATASLLLARSPTLQYDLSHKPPHTARHRDYPAAQYHIIITTALPLPRIRCCTLAAASSK